MASNVNITSNGIQKVLKNYKEKQAIAEYLWNGFDAGANQVELNYKANALGFIEQLEIADNGYGISYKSLKVKFNPFYESEKALQLPEHRSRSAMHGKNGVGRLTFFTFASDARWQTTFLDNDVLKSAVITIAAEALNNYQARLLEEPLAKHPGTRVLFANLKLSAEDLQQVIIPFLKAEFCWFLELNKDNKYRILVNGEVLDYSDTMQVYEDQLVIPYDDGKTSFKVKFVQWKESLHRELSRVYYLNEKGAEVHKEYTTLNKKADEYFHSVYIQSEFFTDFDFTAPEFEAQVKLYSRTKTSPEYKFLYKKINELLRTKRKVFLKTHSASLLDRYQQEGIFPPAASGKVKPKQQQELIHVLKAFYEIQPKLFSSLSIDQKKTIVAMLDALLQSNQRQRILPILEQIVDLDQQEREELDAVLGR